MPRVNLLIADVWPTCAVPVMVGPPRHAGGGGLRCVNGKDGWLSAVKRDEPRTPRAFTECGSTTACCSAGSDRSGGRCRANARPCAIRAATTTVCARAGAARAGHDEPAQVPGSTEPVKVKEPHFSVLREWQGDPSYAKRYELFCQRLVRERLYDAACFLLSDEERGREGWYAEPSDELTFQYFAAALSGRVAALVQQDEPGG